jgi:hypothetical protein
VELLLHPRGEGESHRPDPEGRLSTIGHGPVFRDLVRALEAAGIRFMVIGGTFRDVAIRAASTRDIDIVLIDRQAMPEGLLEGAGFRRLPDSPWAWERSSEGRKVEVQVAALASTKAPQGPFSVASRQAEVRKIEGIDVLVPRIEDYVILKLVAAAEDRKRRARDLADVQDALEAGPESRSLSTSALRARMRDVYGFERARREELVSLLRSIPSPPRR